MPGEDLSGISVNAEDTPEPGGMIAHNPANPADQWYVGKKFFEDNYESTPMPGGAETPLEGTATSDQVPSVGRIVHYVAYGTPGGEFPSGLCRAAVITSVPAGAEFDLEIGLCILNPTGMFFNEWVAYDANKAPGTWHWPERT